MSGPVIFIATNRLKEGTFDAERQRVPGLAGFVETNEPRLIAFHEYASGSRDEVTVVQVHPDVGGQVGPSSRSARARMNRLRNFSTDLATWSDTMAPCCQNPIRAGRISQEVSARMGA